MKFIEITLKEYEDGQVYTATKRFTWKEYRGFAWSTLAGLFNQTVTDLDIMLDEEKNRKRDYEKDNAS